MFKAYMYYTYIMTVLYKVQRLKIVHNDVKDFRNFVCHIIVFRHLMQ